MKSKRSAKAGFLSVNYILINKNQVVTNGY